MTTRRTVLAILGFIALALTGHVQAQQKIRLGVLPFSESLGAIVADQQGFFKAEGLNVEISNVGSGAQGVPLLLSGRMDIVFRNTVTTLQALEQGLDGTILAPGAVARSQPPDTGAILVLKGAIGAPKQLQGKRIAVNVINSTAWMYMSAFLEKHGVARDQVRFVEVPFPQMNDALLNKQVDAIVQVEPFTSVVTQTGKVDVAGYLYSLAGLIGRQDSNDFRCEHAGDGA
jgi:NitT/TauT family transport system substrate-binding protein